MRACFRLPALAVAFSLLSACGSPQYAALPAGNPQKAAAFIQPNSWLDRKIQHVVVIIQENRSFDNLFQGVPGADTRSWGYDSKGDRVPLKPIDLASFWDLQHVLSSFLLTCDGRNAYPGTGCRMDGWDKEPVTCGQPGQPPCPYKMPQYGYVPQSETKPYFDIASQYVIADRMFASNLDGSSFISHQYIIAAQANSATNIPEGGPWGCGGGAGDKVPTVTKERALGPSISPCFNNQTIGDELDKLNLPWKYYASARNTGFLWSAYQAIKHIRNGPDWKKDVVSPPTRFFTDIKKGDLGAVTWITPSCPNSDHAGCNSHTGPEWVATLVNAIGESQFWKSTAVFIFWDDPGGWYDHVPPHKVDYDGLGYRIPMLIVSPYARQGYVSHVQYEHGSILRFIEERFGLATLAASDARATSPARDAFDFDREPRKFVPIPSKMTQEDFLRQPVDYRDPDDE